MTAIAATELFSTKSGIITYEHARSLLALPYLSYDGGHIKIHLSECSAQKVRRSKFDERLYFLVGKVLNFAVSAPLLVPR